jgi:plasmid stability protein
MASLTLKNIPETVYKKLKIQAKLNHRSINGELINMLEKLLEGKAANFQEIIEQGRITRSWANGKLSADDIQEAKAEGRK